jgi:Insect cuticle protein
LPPLCTIASTYVRSCPQNKKKRDRHAVVIAFITSLQSQISLPFDTIFLNAAFAPTFTTMRDLMQIIDFNMIAFNSQSNPSYQFGFDVKDDEFTNYQNRKETRDGGVIKGSYSVVDSDGFIRTVTYTADPKEGFKAEVVREPTDIVIKVPTPAPATQQQHQQPQQTYRQQPKQQQQYAQQPQQQYAQQQPQQQQQYRQQQQAHSDYYQQ